MTDTLQVAKEKAVAYIGISRHRTSGKVKDKLSRDGFDADTIEQVIEYLEAIDYLDDERAAQHLLSQYKGRKGRSKAMLRALLLARGVALACVEQVISNLKADDALAKDLVESTFPQGATREAIYKRLISRGFHQNLAAMVSRSMSSDDPEN